MKAALLYGSTHGRTRKVVAESLPRLAVEPEGFDVKTIPPAERLAGCDLLLFFTPTYGDGELQPDMEEFIRQFSLDMTGKRFVICELGGYIGYDKFSFGAMLILRQCLVKLGGKELCTPLSLDSLPRVNWPHLHGWIDHVNRSLDGYVGR